MGFPAPEGGKGRQAGGRGQERGCLSGKRSLASGSGPPIDPWLRGTEMGAPCSCLARPGPGPGPAPPMQCCPPGLSDSRAGAPSPSPHQPGPCRGLGRAWPVSRDQTQGGKGTGQPMPLRLCPPARTPRHRGEAWLPGGLGRGALGLPGVRGWVSPWGPLWGESPCLSRYSAPAWCQQSDHLAQLCEGGSLRRSRAGAGHRGWQPGLAVRPGQRAPRRCQRPWFGARTVWVRGSRSGRHGPPIPGAGPARPLRPQRGGEGRSWDSNPNPNPRRLPFSFLSSRGRRGSGGGGER